MSIRLLRALACVLALLAAPAWAALDPLLVAQLGAEAIPPRRLLAALVCAAACHAAWADRSKLGEKGVKNKQGEYVIPPNATLVYDIDLISNKQKIVETPKAAPAAPKFNAGRKDEGGK